MSTKFTIWHDVNTHVFGESFDEDIVGIEISNPIEAEIKYNKAFGSVLTLTLSKDHLAEIAKAYLSWRKNTCNNE